MISPVPDMLASEQDRIGVGTAPVYGLHDALNHAPPRSYFTSPAGFTNRASSTAALFFTLAI